MRSTYREQPDENHYKDDKGGAHAVYTLTGEAYVRATFKIVDVSTGRLIVAKTYEEKRDDTNRGAGQGAAGDRLPRAGERGPARGGGSVHEVHRSPPGVHVRELPEGLLHPAARRRHRLGGAGRLEEGAGHLQYRGQDAEKNVKLKSGQIAKCYWNLGLSYEYAGDYDKAEGMVNKAYALSNQKDMLGDIDNIHRLQADARRLAEQTAVLEAIGAK